jgi:hypothetical protein
MFDKLRISMERLGVWWCRLQHGSLFWPMHGEYRCASCYRRYRVAWDAPASVLGHD